MKLSASNIGWTADVDDMMYQKLAEYGYTGLEIAPTRIFPDNPYSHIRDAEEFAEALQSQYNLTISSMQSIWYGKTEKIFSTEDERKILLDYTRQAVDFAQALECGNLVFGCPRNRVSSSERDVDTALSFFGELGDYAKAHGTVLSLEANPEIYHTNFITTTEEAIALVRNVSSNGFKLNLDFGTMIYQNESVDLLRGVASMVNHVHISEPNLVNIVPRIMHNELASFLSETKYQNFVSLEMGNQNSLDEVDDSLRYMTRIFV